MWLKRSVPMEGRQFRDPRAATMSPMQYFWLRRNFSWNAKQAVSEALYSNIYLYACARARAVDLASLPVRVGADPANPADYDPKHPLAKLLGPAPGKPTINISSRQLIAWSSMQFDITGRFAWEIAPPVTAGRRGRRDGVPFELWPLPSGNLTPVQTRSGADWWSAFDYEVGGVKRTLPADSVLYHWRPSQHDWREPESLIRAAGLNVSIATMQDRYDYAFLTNDARPAAVMVHEEFNRKKERDAFRRQFIDTHQGADNAGKMMFVEANREGSMPKDSLFIQTLGLSQRDAEFIERYENQIRAICVAMAVPLSRLADSSRRTYANAERETKNYWVNGVWEQAVEVAEGINTDLMPLIDTSNVMWFDKTGVCELEPPRRYAVGDIPELIAAKVITRNESRASLYLPPVDGGDEFEDHVAAPTPAPHPSDVAPAALPPASEYSAHNNSVIRAISHDCSSRASILAQRMLDSMQSRLGSKRGRQAITRGSTAWDLLDEAYWFDVACVEFGAWARAACISACIDARVSPNEQRIENWSERWGHALADRWMQSWRTALQVPADMLDSFQPDEISIDPLVSQTVWVSARSAMANEQVELESVTDLILRLQSGEVTLQDALLSLG